MCWCRFWIRQFPQCAWTHVYAGSSRLKPVEFASSIQDYCLMVTWVIIFEEGGIFALWENRSPSDAGNCFGIEIFFIQRKLRMWQVVYKYSRVVGKLLTWNQKEKFNQSKARLVKFLLFPPLNSRWDYEKNNYAKIVIYAQNFHRLLKICGPLFFCFLL